MKKYLLIVVAFLVSVSAYSQSAKTIYERGLISYEIPGLEESAVADFREAASQGYVDAEFALGVCYEKGKGVKKNMKEALNWYRLAADHGNVKAQYNLGACYNNGKGVKKNLKEAATWFLKSADGGYMEAQYVMGLSYLKGTGVTVDYDEAVRYLTLAAEQGQADAQYQLGLLYYDGKKIPNDYEKAAKWFEKLAGNESYLFFKDVAAHMFQLYIKGYGGVQHEEKALDMYVKAAEVDRKTAMFQIGIMYYDGQGLKKNYAKSARWMRKAAEEGYPEAQAFLGAMLFDGVGVYKNTYEALYWLFLASYQGNESAKALLEEYGEEENVDVYAYKKTFSVSEDTKAIFAPGNVQYQPSTQTWRFAEHQWDVVGEANKNISSSYDGWIDLFGYGTGDVPTRSSQIHSSYGSFSDWGDHISNDGDKQWRTPTLSELSQTLYYRPTMSGIRYAKATVDGVVGMLLLPDCWDETYYKLNKTNTRKASYDSNVISQSDWTSKLEANGAVFLPAAGIRDGNSVAYYTGHRVTEVRGGGGMTMTTTSVAECGYYWSASLIDKDHASCLYFSNGKMQLFTETDVILESFLSNDFVSNGHAVRLISLVGEKNAVGKSNSIAGNSSSCDKPDAFSVSENKKVCFAKGNLQYQASTDTWRFAEHQWDFIGDDNKNISWCYSGWIDFFGWGTGYDPTLTSKSCKDYSFFADWGLNDISNGGGKVWFTLTKEEWEYVFYTRKTSSGIRYAKAKINDVNGLVLLPDKWSSSYYSLNNTNQTEASFSDNTISQDDWTNKLEVNGAVFLPAAGDREGPKINYVGSSGSYWSMSGYTTCLSYYVWFGDSSMGKYGDHRDEGHSVRLVCSAEE